ncbi:MAG TPA: FxsA family protein [Pseudolabrys sp.]|nr:FxsA family protein [Pseudolabrys sp.]
MKPFRRPFSPAKWLILAILAAPALELAAFIAVAVIFGIVPALLGLVGLSLLGMLLLRGATRPVARLRVELDRQTVAGFDLRDGSLARIAAAILLIVPGFITGALGLLLLIPAIRQLLGWGLQRLLRAAVAAADPAAGDPSVVDLPPEDWRTVPEQRLPRAEPEPPQRPDKGPDASSG